MENDSGGRVDVETVKPTQEAVWLAWWGIWWFILPMTVGMERKGWTGCILEVIGTELSSGLYVEAERKGEMKDKA